MNRWPWLSFLVLRVVRERRVRRVVKGGNGEERGKADERMGGTFIKVFNADSELHARRRQALRHLLTKQAPNSLSNIFAFNPYDHCCHVYLFTRTQLLLLGLCIADYSLGNYWETTGIFTAFFMFLISVFGNRDLKLRMPGHL